MYSGTGYCVCHSTAPALFCPPFYGFMKSFYAFIYTKIIIISTKIQIRPKQDGTTKQERCENFQGRYEFCGGLSQTESSNLSPKYPQSSRFCCMWKLYARLWIWWVTSAQTVATDIKNIIFLILRTLHLFFHSEAYPAKIHMDIHSNHVTMLQNWIL